MEAEASSEKDGWHPGVYSFRKHDDDNDDYYGGVGGCGGDGGACGGDYD